MYIHLNIHTDTKYIYICRAHPLTLTIDGKLVANVYCGVLCDDWQGDWRVASHDWHARESVKKEREERAAAWKKETLWWRGKENFEPWSWILSWTLPHHNPLCQKRIEMVPEPRGVCFKLWVKKSRSCFSHSPRSHIGYVLWSSEPDSCRKFSRCFWSAFLAFWKMRFRTDSAKSYHPEHPGRVNFLAKWFDLGIPLGINLQESSCGQAMSLVLTELTEKEPLLQRR